jgi:hypothetical protein
MRRLLSYLASLSDKDGGDAGAGQPLELALDGLIDALPSLQADLRQNLKTYWRCRECGAFGVAAGIPLIRFESVRHLSHLQGEPPLSAASMGGGEDRSVDRPFVKCLLRRIVGWIAQARLALKLRSSFVSAAYAAMSRQAVPQP